MGVLSPLVFILLASTPDPFAEYLAAPFTPADGFDFPVGDAEGAGFRVTTAFGESYALGLHPGEDWNGIGEAVYAIGAGLLTEKQRAAIVEQWQARMPTDQRTTLGGGIGFHGWAGKWEGPSARLSWGCVVMHEKDLEALYDEIPIGALVVIR